jgi:hypothetical protein
MVRYIFPIHFAPPIPALSRGVHESFGIGIDGDFVWTARINQSDIISIFSLT